MDCLPGRGNDDQRPQGERFGRALASRALASKAIVASVVAAVGLTLASCSSERIPMPSQQATPEDVVRAYADAVHAGDCITADALAEVRSESWCGQVDITTLTVTETTQEQRETESGDGPLIERVWVDLNSKGGDISLPDGAHSWSYFLDRTGPGGAWRIYSQGMG